jgi:membrane protease YdiL (CAAX protease family)
MPLLRSGFDRPMRNLPRTTRGFLIAMVAMAALVFAAAVMGARSSETAIGLWLKIPQYLLAAVAVAIIEEGFFRAFLLGGMEGDIGPTGAILLSSAIYAIAHLVRSRSKVPLAGFHPLAGFETIGLSLSNLGHPLVLLPTFIGLFLLGIVLAEAFLRTGTVYFSMGLHAGFVVGAKMWPHMTSGGLRLPGWLGGYGPQPLVSGVAAWAIAIALLLLIRPLTRTSRA